MRRQNEHQPFGGVGVRIGSGEQYPEPDEDDLVTPATESEGTEEDSSDYDSGEHEQHQESDISGESGGSEDESDSHEQVYVAMEGEDIEIEIDGDQADIEMTIEVERGENDSSGEDAAMEHWVEVEAQIDAHDNEGNAIHVNAQIEDGDHEYEIEPEEEYSDDSSTVWANNAEQSHSAEHHPQEAGSEDLKVIVSNQGIYPLQQYNPGHLGTALPGQNPRNAHLFEECSICFSQLHKGSNNSCYLECLHWYHFTCLRDWSRENRICPICRLAYANILKPC